MTDEDPRVGAAMLDEAAAAWIELERPLEAARSRLLAGQVLVQVDPQAAGERLEEAAKELDRLGVAHLSQRARALSPS